MKKTLICIFSLMFLLSAIAITTPAYSEQVEDRLIFAFLPPAVETNRIWAAEWVNFGQYEPMLETLIGNDPETGEPIPRLAERWEANEDFREWTFYLREGVQFHYGYGEMTAQDVKHTYELLARPDSRVNMASVWRNQVAEVEIIDEYTITFRFHDPYIDGERLFSRTGGELYVTSKAQWDAEGVEGMDERLIGTGVYRYKERIEGEKLVVEAVENHWRDEAPFREIEIRWVPDEPTRLAMILAGEVSATTLGRDVTESALRQGMKVITSQRENMQRFAIFGGLYFNTGEPEKNPENHLLDRRVRQALIKAIDLQEIQEVFYRGRANQYYLAGWVPQHEGWNEEWAERFDEMYGYDLERARELIAESGFKPGDITVRINSYEHEGQIEAAQVMESLYTYWSAIGVNAEITPVDLGTFLSRWFEDGDIHGEVAPTRNTPIRTTQEFIRFWYTTGSPARIYLHDFVEEKFEELVQALDPTKRDRLAREIGNHIFEEFTVIPLGATHVEIVVNPDVIADWVWPGQAPYAYTHYFMIEPAS